jgi:DNA adenine methylase
MLIEPFAGGGIVSLTAVAENLVERAHMVELDYLVAAVWETIINDDDGAEWLAERIVTFDLTLENVKQTLEPVAESTRERAFQAILKNRVNRGGIMAPGAGLVKLGEEGKGLHSRWYPETLKKRILAIAALRERLIFQHSDGLTIMRQNAEREHAVFFIDPPYTASQKRAGSRLYSYPDVDHRQLFRLAAGVAGDVLLTYDNADEVRELAAEFGFNTQTIAMKNTHHARMSELLIGNDLAWLRS